MMLKLQELENFVTPYVCYFAPVAVGVADSTFREFYHNFF